jgi:hypothetical protein
LIREKTGGAHDLGGTAPRVEDRKRTSHARELLDHRHFLGRIGRDGTREIADGGRAVVRDGPARVTLCSGETMKAVRDQKPHGVRAPEVGPTRVSTQIGAIRFERRLERQHALPILDEGNAKIGCRADSHKDTIERP